MADAAPDARCAAVRAQRDGGVRHLVERVVDRRPRDEGHRPALSRRELARGIVDLRRHVDEHGSRAAIGPLRCQADRRGSAERHADDAPGGGRHRRHQFRNGVRVLPRPVVTVGTTVRMSVTGEVDGDGRAVEGEHDRVPGVRVLGTAVQEHKLRIVLAPTQV